MVNNQWEYLQYSKNQVKIKPLIEKVLENYDRLWNKEKTELNQTLLIDLVEKYDEKILSLLFNNNSLKEKFFVKINKNYVFKNRDFRFFLEENKINNSYTQYKNRIGLTDGKRFLKDTPDVVLNYPYKDCILEGGQSTEKGEDIYFEYNKKVTATDEKKGYKENSYNKKQAKRKEIFFNEILATDEIDRLLDEKALVNWQRIYKGKNCGQIKEKKPTAIKRDESNTIKENLIIKGNNLLALHSLKKQFTEKVKLIYIDPPYNTGGDANIFTYNNNFNHSTWLTFMKNRLDVGKQLLKNDGFIAIAIDHCELGYLIVLADEIFGRENRLGIITVVHNFGGRQDDKFFSTANEYMLVYAKNKDSALLKNFELSEVKKKEYNKIDDRGKYKIISFQRTGSNSNRTDRPNLFFPIYYNENHNKFSLQEYKGYKKILPIDKENNEKCWRWGIDKVSKNLTELVFRRINNRETIYLKSRIEEHPGEKAKTIWNKSNYSGASGTNLLKKFLGKNIFSYPKSLYTVLDTLKITTEKDDIILDFHAGSGTTGHAVLALNKEDGGNRKFILVEQLDKHIDICIKRNKKVLQKENIDDSFIYCELAKWNEQAKEKILECKNTQELENFFNEIVEKYFLNYNLKIKEFQEIVIKEENFQKLSLDEQKQIFITMLDNNQVYVNKTEMSDKKYGISEADITWTEEFYKINYGK